MGDRNGKAQQGREGGQAKSGAGDGGEGEGEEAEERREGQTPKETRGVGKRPERRRGAWGGGEPAGEGGSVGASKAEGSQGGEVR